MWRESSIEPASRFDFGEWLKYGNFLTSLTGKGGDNPSRSKVWPRIHELPIHEKEEMK